LSLSISFSLLYLPFVPLCFFFEALACQLFTRIVLDFCFSLVSSYPVFTSNAYLLNMGASVVCNNRRCSCTLNLYLLFYTVHSFMFLIFSWIALLLINVCIFTYVASLLATSFHLPSKGRGVILPPFVTARSNSLLYNNP
jgi:hypothetical protein